MTWKFVLWTVEKIGSSIISELSLGRAFVLLDLSARKDKGVELLKDTELVISAYASDLLRN